MNWFRLGWFGVGRCGAGGVDVAKNGSAGVIRM